MAEQSSEWRLWWTVGGIIFVLAVLSNDFWATLGILGGAAACGYALIRVFRHSETSTRQAMSKSAQRQLGHEPTLAELTGSTRRVPPSANAKAQSAAPTTHALGRGDQLPSSRTITGITAPKSDQPEKLYSIQTPASASASTYALPKRSAGTRDGCWVPAGESVQVGGITLPGGMIYVGSRLSAPNGRIDPCLINDRLPIAPAGDYRERPVSAMHGGSRPKAVIRDSMLPFG